MANAEGGLLFVDEARPHRRKRGIGGGASLVPVYRQLVGDTLTPVSAFCKIQEGEWSFLFESVVGGERVLAMLAGEQLPRIC